MASSKLSHLFAGLSDAKSTDFGLCLCSKAQKAMPFWKSSLLYDSMVTLS